MSRKTYVYISCWDNLGGAPGIGILEMDPETGGLTLKDVVEKDVSCGFSCVDREKGILYICNETEDHPDYFKGGGGRIFAFGIDPDTGMLSKLAEIPTFCPNPSYLAFDEAGRYMLAANYSGYNAVTKIVAGDDGEYHCEEVYDDAVTELISVDKDGIPGKILDADYHVQKVGGRYLHSHPQSMVRMPFGDFFINCDVAENRIYTYSIDTGENKLVRMNVYQDEKKSKPRYCVFSKDLPLMYVNYEGKKELGVFSYEENGVITPVTEVCGVPDSVEYPAGKGQSGLLMHPSGKYIYDLMTSTASVAVFGIDDGGIPEPIQYLPSKQEKLRAIGISPDGRYLITTCIQSGAIDVYSIGEDGMLTDTGNSAEIKGAAFVSFYET